MAEKQATAEIVAFDGLMSDVEIEKILNQETGRPTARFYARKINDISPDVRRHSAAH